MLLKFPENVQSFLLQTWPQVSAFSYFKFVSMISIVIMTLIWDLKDETSERRLGFRVGAALNGGQEMTGPAAAGSLNIILILIIVIVIIVVLILYLLWPSLSLSLSPPSSSPNSRKVPRKSYSWLLHFLFCDHFWFLNKYETIIIILIFWVTILSSSYSLAMSHVLAIRKDWKMLEKVNIMFPELGLGQFLPCETLSVQCTAGPPKKWSLHLWRSKSFGWKVGAKKSWKFFRLICKMWTAADAEDALVVGPH